MSSFPSWLDPATLAWAAEYCEAMARHFPARLDAATGANVCATGIRAAIENSRSQPPPARPQWLQVVEPTDREIERSQARMEKLFGRAWLEGKE